MWRDRVTVPVIIVAVVSVMLVLGGCGRAAAPPRLPGLVELTIDGAHAALRDGRVSCEQLTQGYLARIRVYDPPPESPNPPGETDESAGSAAAASSSPGGDKKPVGRLPVPKSPPDALNAIIGINPNALDRARALDAEQARLGRLRTLHCIPVLLKDNFDTADMPTAAGSAALAGSVPPDDAFLVRQLRAAGAIVLAKTNMGEWAFSPYRTISSTHGETRNPYDLARVPAGSSGGTAAGIAANLGIIGMGTDTGNSIRGPASHTGLVGIRPSLGATSRDGIVPLLSNRDVGGPLMRTVRDAAIVLSVLAGPDPADPITAAAHARVPADYRRFLRADGLQGARIGVLRALVETETADPAVMAAFERALADITRAGATLVDPFVIPRFEALTEATGFCSRFRFDLAHYLRALGEEAPIRSLDQVVTAGLFLPRHADAMAWAMAERSDPAEQAPPCVDVAGDPRRKALLDAVVRAMDQAGVEALAYPSWNNPPRRIGDDDSPHGNNSPIIAPHSGQPAITVPMGFTAGGLPLGLQLLARPFDEGTLFRLAYAYEQATHHRRPPPGFGPLPSAVRSGSAAHLSR
jgi:Asp-tRNA(Asn)/Glu-tRNA(Gln) amidotransferase A subunit family amidase